MFAFLSQLFMVSASLVTAPLTVPATLPMDGIVRIAAVQVRRDSMTVTIEPAA